MSAGPDLAPSDHGEAPPFPGAFSVLGLHAVIGPPLGALMLWAILLARHLIVGRSSPGWSENPLEVLGFMALFSYLLGGVQALLCGAWLALRTAARGSYGYIEGVAAALGATCIVTALVGGRQGWEMLLADVLYYGAVGAGAALVLRASMPGLARRGWLRR